MASGDELIKELSGDELLKELLPFLDVLTPAEYKLKLLDHLLGMTGTSDGVLLLSKNLKLIGTFMTLIINDPDSKTRLLGLTILVNLTSSTTDKKLELKLLDIDFLCFISILSFIV